MARSTSSSLGVTLVGGLCFLATLALVSEGVAQDAGSACGVDGFDICFPNLTSGAPSAACTATEEGAADISACLANVCGGVATEPEPGFFSYCCADGGSVKFDDFCVFVVQTACVPVATLCTDRCPPLELLTGTVPLAPPPAACLPDYPAFINSVCESDPFCCTTSWDEICATAALSAGLVAGVLPAASPAAAPSAAPVAAPAAAPSAPPAAIPVAASPAQALSAAAAP